jgi:hypothetical protein
VFAVLFVSNIATSWSSYERLVSTGANWEKVGSGANWEKVGSDFKTFHGGINQERIPMAARIDTTSSIFSSMAESVHAFSKPNGKLLLYYLFIVFLTKEVLVCLINGWMKKKEPKMLPLFYY